MRKYFRLHRRLLGESLETMREVNSLSEIHDILDGDVFPKNYLSNIHIGEDVMHDDRVPKEWGPDTYYVLADFDGYKNQCVGYSNFYEL